MNYAKVLMNLTQEQKIEKDLIEKLKSLCYQYNQNIKNKEILNINFRQKFNTLNNVNLADSEFYRLKVVKNDILQ